MFETGREAVAGHPLYGVQSIQGWVHLCNLADETKAEAERLGCRCLMDWSPGGTCLELYVISNRATGGPVTQERYIVIVMGSRELNAPIEQRKRWIAFQVERIKAELLGEDRQQG